MSGHTSSQVLWTCSCCQLGFSEAALQRAHFNEDLHRYNAKRRAADLPAVSAAVFDAKVLRKREGIGSAPSEDRRCEVCSKTFRSEGTFAAHLHSKKHKEMSDRSVRRPANGFERASASANVVLPANEEADKVCLADVTRIGRLLCLFCPRSWGTFEEKLRHMQTQHGFFVPDQEYLVDLEGLVERAATQIAHHNTCLYCDAAFGFHAINDVKGSELRMARRGLDAVRKHMNAKGHCKLPWESEAERFVWSDFYDYSPSYVDDEAAEADAWEDLEDSVDESEAVDAVQIDAHGPSVRMAPAGHGSIVRFGDSRYELILPSGARIGHKALRHIYRQNLVPYALSDTQYSATARKAARAPQDWESGPNNVLVPLRRNEVVRAKSSGEAKYAQRATQLFLGCRAREAHRTRVGIRVGNHQKHFRDMLLQ